MASETVNRILSAEAEYDRKLREARSRAEEIVRDAERSSSVAVQKKLGDANYEIQKIRAGNEEKLAEYTALAEEKCLKDIENIENMARLNFEKAVGAVIQTFFSRGE